MVYCGIKVFDHLSVPLYGSAFYLSRFPAGFALCVVTPSSGQFRSRESGVFKCSSGRYPSKAVVVALLIVFEPPASVISLISSKSRSSVWDLISEYLSSLMRSGPRKAEEMAPQLAVIDKFSAPGWGFGYEGTSDLVPHGARTRRR